MDDSSSNLKYWWTLAVKHNGAKQRVHARSVFVEWKPLIWYIKGQKPTNMLDTMFDHIESSPPDKSLHEWAQSPKEPEHIIRYLTVENQVILDPMMGNGTTGIAALKLNRKFIGIEIDQECFDIGRNKIFTTISTSSAAEIENNNCDTILPVIQADFSNPIASDFSSLAEVKEGTVGMSSNNSTNSRTYDVVPSFENGLGPKSWEGTTS